MMKNLRKFMALLFALLLATGISACANHYGTKNAEKEAAGKTSITSSNTQTTSLEVSENLAPPVEGRKIAVENPGDPNKEEKKGIIIVDEQAIVKGYDQVPVLFDSYGTWIDEKGQEMSGNDAKQVFAELPSYAQVVIDYNKNLVALDTKPRKLLLETYDDRIVYYEFAMIEDEPYIKKRLENLIAQWKEDQAFLNFVDPTADGAYELYNEILGLEPEAVPLCRDAESGS